MEVGSWASFDPLRRGQRRVSTRHATQHRPDIKMASGALKAADTTAEPYPPDSVLARLADVVLELDDGQLSAHADRLCHGALEEAVSLAMAKRQLPNVQLQIPFPGCSKKDVFPFLRLVYSLKPEDTARVMTLEDLRLAGQTADRFGFSHVVETVENGLLRVFYGQAVPQVSFITSAISLENVFLPLSWADKIRSRKIATMCGAYIGANYQQCRDCDLPEAVAFYAAMRSYKGGPAQVAIPS